MDDPKFLAEKVDIEIILGVHFQDAIRVREAMYVHKAHTGRLENGVSLEEANHCLALPGDALLRFVLLDSFWHEVGPGNVRAKVEELSNRVKMLESDENLSIVADEHGITSLMRKWYPRAGLVGVAKKGPSTTVEALIMAVYLDSGGDLEVVRKVVEKLLKVKLNGGQARRLTASEEAVRLIAELDRGGHIDIKVLLSLLASIVRQSIKGGLEEAVRKVAKTVGKVFGKFQ